MAVVVAVGGVVLGDVSAGGVGLNNPVGTFAELELFDMAAVVVEADSGGCVGTIPTIKALCGWGDLMSLVVTHVTGILNDSDLRWAVKGESWGVADGDVSWGRVVMAVVTVGSGGAPQSGGRKSGRFRRAIFVEGLECNMCNDSVLDD